MRYLSCLSLALALGFSFSFSSALNAGMSVSVGDLEGVIKSNPRFDSLFIDNLELGPAGNATRLGGNHPDVSGKPSGPYQFPARFASDGGSDYPLIATLHTQLIFENAAGEVVDSQGEAVSYRERLLRVDLQDTEGMTSEEITRALNKLFEGSSSAGSGSDPKAMDREAPPKNEDGTTANAESLGAGAFSNELKEGDRKYAGEYHCDDYTVQVGAGQTLTVAFQPNGFIPVIMSKKDGRYSTSAGRYDGEAIGELASFTYTSPKNAEVIISLTTRDKGEAGTYEASFTLNGKALTPASNVEGSGYVPVQ